MMEKLLRRGEILAQVRQRQKAQSVAQQLRAMLGAGAVEVEEARVLVSGRGIVKRWLIEPSLRFLGRGPA